MTQICPSRTHRRSRGQACLRSTLAMATALVSGLPVAALLGTTVVFACSSAASAQTVLLAPKGSHKAPSADLPVYAGADSGQNAPSPLSVPPLLRSPVSLAPGANPAVAPIDAAAAPAAPADVSAPAADSPPPQAADATSAAAESTPTPASEPVAPPAPTPVAEPATPAPVVPTARPVAARPRVVVADAPKSAESAPTADSLNDSEYDRLVKPRAASPVSRRVVAAGDAPVYPGAVGRAVQVQANADELPASMRYQPRMRDLPPNFRPGQAAQQTAQYTPQAPLIDNVTPSADAPLLTTGAAAGLGASTALPGQSAPRPALYQPNGAVALPPPNATTPGFGTGGYDPVTQEIDRSIAQLRASLAPTFQMSAEYDGHSGSPGLSRLNTILTPMEATFAPGGVGQMKLTVTPSLMMAGTLENNAYSQQTFGTMALGVKGGSTGGAYTAPTYSGGKPGAQTAFGAGVDLRYTLGTISGDLGSTPFGFLEQNLIGGLQWVPALTANTNLRFVAERRAVQESFLSFGGATDAYTGRRWGGVVRESGKVGIETAQGPWNIYAQIGGGYYTGDHVASNSAYDASTGATYPVWKYRGEELRMGVDLHYTAFAKNLRYFSLGQGGYFSPQRDLAALIPITYHNQVDRGLWYELRGSVGYQQFAESSSLYFPNDPALQAQLATLALSNSVLSKSYAGQRSSGITGGFNGEVNYRIGPNLWLGAKGGFQQSGVYQEFGASVFAKYVFNGLYDQ